MKKDYSYWRFYAIVMGLYATMLIIFQTGATLFIITVAAASTTGVFVNQWINMRKKKP